jgi:hypothetical protein
MLKAKNELRTAFVTAAGFLLGIAIWWASPGVTGHVEPWDAENHQYSLSLIFAEFVERLPEVDLFHLAPHIFFKFRRIQASRRRRAEIVEAALASYVVTMDEGAGQSQLRESPVLGFAFCYLAAHCVTDLLDEATVERLMDVCVARRDHLSRLVAGGS